MQQTDIIVIGAGLTGLTCAHHLSKKNRNFIVVETQNHVGGVINTVKEDGFVYETGPNTGVISHPEVADLFEDLKDKMTYEVADESAKKRYVLKNGKWVALPSGLIGGVTTPLFSWFDKLRLLGEPFRKPGTNPEETLDEMVKRRMGKSFLSYAVDPFILGVYAGDPSQLVTKYALPKLYNLEQNYGSFIGGSVKKMREPKDPEMQKATKKIFSAKGGLSNFMGALENSIGKERILLDLQNITVEKNENGYLLKAINAGGEAVEIQAKQVVSTAGAYALPELFPFLPVQQVDKIKNLHYTRVVEVALGFKQWKGRPLDAFGALIPFCEKRDILGIMFMSTLFEGRAPKGGALVTIFMGGVRRQEMCDLDDHAIREVVTREAKDLLELDDFNPDLFKIMRHSYAIPQYRADSKERFEAIEQLEAQYPGLTLAGNIRNGIGMADRIKQGKIIAEIL